MIATPLSLWLDGTNVRDFGAYCSELPAVVPATKRFITYEIPGRSGVVTRWLGDYEEIYTAFKLLCHADDLADVLAELNSASTICFGNDPDYTRGFRIERELDIKPINLDLREISARIVCSPYKWRQGETPHTVLAGTPLTLTNPGNAESFPLIKVTGTGAATVTVNGVAWSVANLANGLTIDAWNQLVTNTAGALAWTSIDRSDLPHVASGADLVISTTATSLQVTPNWRWI